MDIGIIWPSLRRLEEQSHILPAHSAHLRRSGRFGDPAESGGLCADLCSAQAAYITGQNLLIDGGAYPGTY